MCIRDSAAPAATAARTADASSRHVVITIAREYGSGGHLLGEKLASMLHIPLYDNQFIGLAARRSGMDEAYILHNEQSIPSFWLKCIFAQTNGARMNHSLSPEDVLFVAESHIVQELASREACVIVGRCADFVLRDDPRAVRIFCCTDPESARRRCIAEYGIAPDAADAEVRRVNRNRKTHYEYYTGERWGDPHRFDLTVNTGRVSVEDAARTVAGLYRERLAALPAYPAHPVPGAAVAATAGGTSKG